MRVCERGLRSHVSIEVPLTEYALYLSTQAIHAYPA